MTGQSEKTAVVKRVASTGGIIFEDEPDKWYNPTGTAKPYIKKELEGKRVTIKMGNKDGVFSFISLCKDQPGENGSVPPTNNNSSSVYTNPGYSKDDYWLDKAERDVATAKRISRHGALNTAVEMIKTTGSEATIDKVITLAEEILKWLEQ